MIKIVYREVIEKILNKISNSGDSFGIMIDESTDISNVQKTSYCLRYVDSNFVPIEVPGNCRNGCMDGDSLYTQIKNNLTALAIDLINCRAQGHDGASNMRGRLHGVKTRLLNDYPKALCSYCWGYNLNLIGQDGCKHISMQNTTAVAKDIANYVKDSPKRQWAFEAFCMMEDIELSKSLRPLCMTRWVYRRSSLDSLVENYDSLLQWFYELNFSGSSEEKVAELAYTIKLTKFINYFSIRLLQKCFALMHYTQGDTGAFSFNYRS